MSPRAAIALCLLAGCAAAPPSAPDAAAPRDVAQASDLAAPTDIAPVEDRPAVDASSVSDATTVPSPGIVNVDAVLTERLPISLGPVRLPNEGDVVAAWVAPEGDAVIATRDGALFAVDVYGAVREIERVPGDPRGPGDAPVSLVAERDATTPVLYTPAGGIVVRDGWAMRAELPAILRGARARARWGAETLWATAAGIFTTDGPRWLTIDRADAPVTDVVAFAPGGVSPTQREAWVLRAGGALEALRITSAGGTTAVRWTTPVAGLDLGSARAIATFGDARYIARRDDLLRVSPAGFVERLRVPGEYSGPIALAAAGPWLWAAWDNGELGVDLGRIDAVGGVEILARGVMPFARDVTGVQAVHIAADAERGATAVVTLRAEVPAGDGGAAREEVRAVRIVVDARVALAGVAEGTAVTFARLPLRALPPRADAVEAVDFALDGTRVETVTAPPFGWGGGGRLVRDLPTLDFGDHTLGVTVRYRGAEPLRRTRRFTYLSPLGRVPTYEADIAPLYADRCARCHSTGIARDLRGYDRLRAQGPIVAQALLARRMPPDLAVDEPTVLLFTSWVAGGAPR